MAVFWVVAPCSFVELYRRFRDVCCFHHQGDEVLMMEGASTSGTSVNFYQTTRCNNPEDSHLSLAAAMTGNLIYFVIYIMLITSDTTLWVILL
jgi:hypothetical protein